MVLVKRGHPFTPEPPSGGKKKTREYVSPVVRTPLRNVSASGGAQGPAPSPLPSQTHTPVNDDEGERRQNRVAIVAKRRNIKQTILSPALPATPKARPSALHAPAKATPVTPSAINAEVARKPLAVAKLSVEQRNRIFEDWMKIAADNKINAKNSWNVALIDYFSELTFLLDGNAINFQRASCTLDGCVKIYASRVDSVADETGKLLSGLAEGTRKSKFGVDLSAEGTALVLDGGGGEDGGGEDAPSKQSRYAKRAHRPAESLEKSFDALNLKHFDLEFSSDPLFKKMCAEFDESGSKGPLTFNLALDPAGRLLFDSTEAPLIAPAAEAALGDGPEGAPAALPDAVLDVSQLLRRHGSGWTSLEAKSMATLCTQYSFGAGKLGQHLADTLSRLAAMATQSADRMDGDFGPDSPSDSSSDFASDGDGDGLAAERAYEGRGADDGAYDYYEDPPLNSLGPITKDGPASPLAPHAEAAGWDAQGDDLLAYFDAATHRNWAGPEHWKIQRRPPNPIPARESRPLRSAKKEFALDFDIDPVDVDSLFVKANPATITLSRSALDERSSKETLLPEDLHFNSSSLLTLFLKPGWTRQRRAPTAPTETRSSQAASYELEATYWAAAAAAAADASGSGAAADGAPAYDTPIYDAPADDGAYSDYSDGVPSLLPDASAGSAPVPARPGAKNTLAFARTAKKIDIQELKRVLWEQIRTLAADPPARPGDEPAAPAPAPAPTLAGLMSGLGGTGLARESLRDVSTSYCFICLLHLANEHNLDLRTVDNDLVVSPDRALVS